jgi:hypothetical protein
MLRAVAQRLCRDLVEVTGGYLPGLTPGSRLNESFGSMRL